MDIEKIEQLIQVVKSSEVSELSLECEGGKVRIRKGCVQKPVQSKRQASQSPRKTSKSPETVPAPQINESSGAVITAAMVGIFHSFNGSVGVGSVIRTGQVVGTIESMKLMNDVTADIDGTVEEVLVEDGMPVEYGQSLLKLVCE